MAVRNDISSKTRLIKLTQEFIHIQLVLDTFKVKFCFTYLSPSSLVPLENVFKDIDSHNEICFVIGNLNARVGSFQNPNYSDELERKSLDNKINKRGRDLCKILEEGDYVILNDSVLADRPGNITFCNRNGSSVIDLCIVSSKMTNYVDLKVLDCEGSAHFPILISINEIMIPTRIFQHERIIWDNLKLDSFQDNLDNLLSYHDSSSINIREVTNLMYQSALDTKMIRVIKSASRPNFGPVWFDEKCKKEKKCAQHLLQIYRRNKTATNLTNYLNAKRSYKNLIIAKKLKFMNKLDSSLANVKNSREFYKAL